ncbi:MAG: hypothetical protein FWD55_05585, partial [Propionibacteriaceae bacterium]|nr:hypothetical protein [Propionibacteriaceae bacterium]
EFAGVRGYCGEFAGVRGYCGEFAGVRGYCGGFCRRLGVLRWVLVGESVAKQCIHFLAVGFVTVQRQNPPQGRGWG